MSVTSFLEKEKENKILKYVFGNASPFEGFLGGMGFGLRELIESVLASTAINPTPLGITAGVAAGVTGMVAGSTYVNFGFKTSNKTHGPE